MDWNEAIDADADVGRCLAVEDNPLICRWYFAERQGGVWYDLNSGGRIEPTHWTSLPACPSGKPL